MTTFNRREYKLFGDSSWGLHSPQSAHVTSSIDMPLNGCAYSKRRQSNTYIYTHIYMHKAKSLIAINQKFKNLCIITTYERAILIALTIQRNRP